MASIVLTEVLDLCGKAGKKLNQSFMWEAAIPNNIFDGEETELLPMQLVNSNADTILGNIAAAPAITPFRKFKLRKNPDVYKSHFSLLALDWY